MDQSRFNFYNFYLVKTNPYFNFNVKIDNKLIYLDDFDYGFIDMNKIINTKNKKSIIKKKSNKLYTYKIHNKKNTKNLFFF